ncbi:hypothetical protein C7999DRAFT_18545, partial [Corynascus novoguineensis]
ALATTIDEFGREVIACSFYDSKGLKCKMIERSSCYGEYVLTRIVDKSKRLDHDEQDAKELFHSRRTALLDT